MSRPYDDDSWLRDELHGLLVDEPAMAPAAVADDVRRGQVRTRQVRRRSAALAVAALVVAVALPVGLLVRPSSDAAAPVGPSEVPDVPGVSQAWLDSISPALAAQVGWVVDWKDSVVYGDVATGLQLDLQLVPGTQVSQDPQRFVVPSPPYAETAGLHLWFAPRGNAPGAAMAECPADRCARDLPDRTFPTYLDQAATAGNGTSLAPGTLIVDRSYDDGRFVELLAFPVALAPSGPSDQTARNVLTYPLAGAFLDALGTPPVITPPTPTLGPTPRPTPTPSGSPSPYRTRFVKNGITYVAPESDLGLAVAELLPGTVTEVSTVGGSGVGITRTFRIVRDDVGTSVRVTWLAYDGGTPILTPPAAQDPCAVSTPSCTVIQPWSRAGVPHLDVIPPGLWSIVERTGAGGSSAAAYAGSFTIRTVVLQHGSTELVIDSDSRDVSPTGRFTSSSAPGLSADELLALALKMPMPIRYQGLVDTPWTVSGSGSASASASG